MDTNDIVFQDGAKTETCDLLLQHLLHCQGLRQECRAQEVRRWKLRPKHHALEKIMLFVQETGLNPRVLACWQDESFLGRVKQIGTHCHSVTMLKRVYQRLILNWSQRWWETQRHAKHAETSARSWEKEAEEWTWRWQHWQRCSFKLLCVLFAASSRDNLICGIYDPYLGSSSLRHTLC